MVNGINIEVATGQRLDEIGEMYGIKREDRFNNGGEPDEDYRRRLFQYMTDPDAYYVKTISPEELDRRMQVDIHGGHEIIENWAGGKAFKYCRQCKVEVA